MHDITQQRQIALQFHGDRYEDFPQYGTEPMLAPSPSYTLGAEDETALQFNRDRCQNSQQSRPMLPPSPPYAVREADD